MLLGNFPGEDRTRVANGWLDLNKFTEDVGDLPPNSVIVATKTGAAVIDLTGDDKVNMAKVNMTKIKK